MKQPKWDKYEVALLLEAYLQIKANGSKKNDIVESLSSLLRKRATFPIDDKFRNLNGINMRLSELDYIFSSGKVGFKNTSLLFKEIVNLYLNNRAEYDEILLKAKQMVSSIPHYLDEPIRLGDTILDYFELIKTDYSQFVFTNHNLKWEQINSAVYIFRDGVNRRGNVLFEVQHLSTEGQFALYMKRSLMTKEEIEESLSTWDWTNDICGRITRHWHVRQNLTDYFVPKLDLVMHTMEV